MTLGQVLKEGRLRKSMTLRDVERETGISNGHLSLIESGNVASPSPTLLEKLGVLYGVSYSLLMELAGFRTPEPVRHSVEVMREMGDLSESELEQVRRFVGFLRSSRTSEPAKRRKR